MAIILNGDTGISSIGALSGVTSISATNAALTGITSVASNAADTPVILQDSSSNSNTCRAWVNFNGTGTVAIRGSFNVSSITDNNTGDYRVNFTTAMPDTNYSAVVAASDNGATILRTVKVEDSPAPTTSNFIIRLIDTTNTAMDSLFVYGSVFR